MLQLTGEGISSVHSYHFPPAASYCLDGRTLRDAGGAVVVAYSSSFWTGQQRHYTQLTCRGSLFITFENGTTGAAECRGTFADLEVRGNVLLAGGEYLASLVEDDAWRCHRTGTAWPRIQIAASAWESPVGGRRVGLLARADGLSPPRSES
jgi:hypothetical protein